jgi:dTDP-4-amino-4,6-dideoxygalactose transaminase
VIRVPLLDLGPQHEALEVQLLDAMRRVVKSNQFILGPDVEQLEGTIAKYCQSRFAIGVSSGTDALLLALMALEIGPADEVITTPYTFFATAGTIARLGAKAVFVDIDPLTYNIDVTKIERVITPKTKVILPVHLFGQMADMTPILEIAKRNRLHVVEDAAQAIGAESRDKHKAGSLGSAGCFSFFPTKNLGAMGDAGMITTQDADMAEKLRSLRVHGSKPKYYHRFVGGNFRLDALQAAILNVKFPLLEQWTRARQENARRYEILFQSSGLTGPAGIVLPENPQMSQDTPYSHIYNQFIIRTPQRDALRNYLKIEHIETEVYYPRPLHRQECFASWNYKEGAFPESERASQETLALPLYPGLTIEQQTWVVGCIKKFFVSQATVQTKR